MYSLPSVDPPPLRRTRRSFDVLCSMPSARNRLVNVERTKYKEYLWRYVGGSGG